MSELTGNSVSRNEAEHRFEVEVGSELAISQYLIRGSTIYFIHTEVPEALEGQGIGNLLARTGLDYARDNGLRVVPRCPFIAGFIKSHPEYRDLVDAGGKA